MTLARMLLRVSNAHQINLTFWFERPGQLSFQEINLEKMIFISKKMSQNLPTLWQKKKKKEHSNFITSVLFAF